MITIAVLLGTGCGAAASREATEAGPLEVPFELQRIEQEP